MDKVLSYRFQLKHFIELLKSIYGDRDDAILEIGFSGDGFIFYLGQELPETGTIDGIELNFPQSMNVQDIWWFLKRRVD